MFVAIGFPVCFVSGMKIQTRLALFFTVVFGMVFAVMAITVYGLYYNNLKNLLYKSLNNTALVSAFFYLEKDEMSTAEFANIEKQFKAVVSDEYQIYDVDNRLCFGDSAFVFDVSLLDKIRGSVQLSFMTDDFVCYGIFYRDNQGDFVIIAKSERKILSEPLTGLLKIIILAFLVVLLLLVLLSKWASNIAYNPIRQIISQVKRISTNNLDVRIAMPEVKDEIQELTVTFNKLLEKISETVLIQKNFAKYVSHEFKTPLTSILGNLEVFSMKDRTPEEYRRLSANLADQVMQLEQILNTLTIISDLKKNTEPVVQTRIDEVIWEIIDKIGSLYPHSKINVNTEILPDEEVLLSVLKDRTQLLMALFNVIENAVKYSRGKPVEILIFKRDNRLCLSIVDRGIGIKPEDIVHIDKPFYRAEYTNHIAGHGIGLSIAFRILEKNKITYQIESEINKGTKIVLTL